MNFLAGLITGALLLIGRSSFAGPVTVDPNAPAAAFATHLGGLLMIPEPGTACLLALGISGLIFVGRRRPS